MLTPLGAPSAPAWNNITSMSYVSELWRRLKTAGVEPGDSDDIKLKKSLLMFAMGLTTAAPVLWLALYQGMGLNIPTSVPLGYQLASLGTLVVYLVSRNFDWFRVMQLALYLFFPFVLQWTLGDFITASGFVLWGLLAPVGAILLYSPRDSIPWFVAYIVLVIASAAADYYLFSEGAAPPPVPPKTIVVFFALNFVAISSIVYFLLRYAAIEREKSKVRLEEAHRLLQTEQERSERLLLNILPGPVAERLKMEDGTIADGFADVTVMFADIVNFTTLAEGLSPNQIFAMLNHVFSSFDAMAERHGLEKIKTIGDAYMVAGGLNDEATINYSEAIANMALEMRDMLAQGHLDQRPPSRDPHGHRHRAGRRGRGRQEEVHLRPVGRHGQPREPHHRRERARHDPGRRDHLPAAAKPVRVRAAENDLPEGEGRHHRLHPQGPQGRGGAGSRRLAE